MTLQNFFFAHIGNLIPPSDRAYGTIILKKNSDSRNHEKTKFSSRKIFKSFKEF